MDGSAHCRKAEELAAKAEEYLGQGDGHAAVWAAVAQVHVLLALAAPRVPDSGEGPTPLPESEKDNNPPGGPHLGTVQRKGRQTRGEGNG